MFQTLRAGMRRTQPKGLVGINYKNPITQGLQVVINGAFSYDVCRRLTPDLNTNTIVSTDNGECLSFDGTSATRHQYYTSPISDVANGATMFSWVKCNAVDACPIGCYAIGATRYNAYIQIDPSGLVTAVSRSNANYAIAYGTAYTPGAWHKILATFAPSRRTIRFDNNAEVSDTTSLAGLSMNTVIAGGWVDNLDAFTSGLNGFLRLGLVWDRVLSEAEKQSIIDNPDQVFIQSPNTDYSLPLYSQFMRPNGVVSAGNWVSSLGGALHLAVDEQVPLLTDYISTVYASTCELLLSDPYAPVAILDDKVNYYISADSGNMKVSLMQGATIVASWSHIPTPTTPTLFRQVLNSGQLALITDYASLTLKIEAY
jgi:hypothetical protein